MHLIKQEAVKNHDYLYCVFNAFSNVMFHDPRCIYCQSAELSIVIY